MAPKKKDQAYPALHNLIDNLPGVVYRCRNDRSWTMDYMSDAIHELTGYPASDFINNSVRSYNSLIHKEDQDYVWSEIQAAGKDLRRFTLEYRIITADNRTKWVWERGNWVDSEDGREYLEGFIEDITEWKEAREKVRESEYRLRVFAQSAPVGIVVSDKEENTIFVNKHFTDLFGYTIKDMPGVNEWWLLAYPDERVRSEAQATWKRELEKARKERVPAGTMEFPVKCKDGSVRITEFRLASDSESNFVILTDITERKESEEKLLNLQNNLREQVNEKTRELKERVQELERFREATIDRELRMKELRDELEIYKKMNQEKKCY